MYSVALFDLGNVLVRFQPERFWPALGVDDPAIQQQLGSEVITLGRQYESGVLSTAEFMRELTTHLKGIHPPDIERAFASVLPEPVPGMEALVRDVAVRCDTGLVSNTSPWHFQHCLRIGPALKHVQRLYLSYDLKALKPTPQFYAEVIHREACPANQCVFIDDVKENVDGAIAAGMTGIQFRNADQLRAELKTIGVL